MGFPVLHRVDRSNWHPGPWDAEPDKLEWRHQGVACLAVRQNHGAWCGYVAIPKSHPWAAGDAAERAASVHGGITYGPSECHGPVCHIPLPGEIDDIRWIGFDCIHFDDGTPDGRYGGDYRDIDFVKAEVESLAVQALKSQIDMMSI